MSRRLRLASSLMLAVSLLAPARGAAQPATASESQIKAAYLYNFARFVEWPPAALDPETFSICVLGTDPFGAVLDSTLSGLLLRGQPVAPRRIATVDEAQRCQVLFIAASEASRVDRLLAALEGRAVLTVSDIPRFAQRGGMIQFVSQADRVRFEVDLRPAQRARLMMSSDLLRVATMVRGGGEPGD